MKTYRDSRKFTKNDLLNLKVRQSIYQFVLKNPGLHLRELSRKLDIPRSTLNYHLNYLEKKELIVTKKEGRYNRHFIAKQLGEKEKKLLNAVRVETTRNVLLYIMIAGAVPETEIAEELDKHKTTIEFHLKKLLQHDIIEQAPAENGLIYTGLIKAPIINRKKVKNEVFYRLNQPEIIEKLLIVYHKEGYYDDIISEAILSYGEDITKNFNAKKRIKTSNEVIEIGEKIFYDIFPHPYHC